MREAEMGEIAEVIVAALGPDFESSKQDLRARTGALMDRFPLYAELAAV
jgi:glycine/serine hydroxymethyltransferase